jgi:hypothetical protein
MPTNMEESKNDYLSNRQHSQVESGGGIGGGSVASKWDIDGGVDLDDGKKEQFFSFK